MNDALSGQLVLVVEDNPDDERLTLRALRHAIPNPHFLVARDGEEAIALLNRWPEDGCHECALPALVLLDLKLPKVSGHQVLEAFRAHEPTRELPIVVVTSSEDEADIRALWRMGANDYLRKPLDYFQYISAVGSMAKMWLPAAVLA